MAELFPPPPEDASHRIAPDGFFLDVYRLLTHAVASRVLADLEDGSSQRPLSAFVTRNEQPEISRLLISIASSFRVKDDDGNWMHGFWLESAEGQVGSLIADLTKPTQRGPLMFKEACNKIIHANRVHFDGETSTISGRQYLQPLVHLYGTKGRSDWKAELDLLRFCKSAANVIV